MPYAESFTPIYDRCIKQARKKVGSDCTRIDEQNFHGQILARIYDQILEADLLIADMTGLNKNVLYELGYAHALKKTCHTDHAVGHHHTV